jgi:hypothetical protein
MESMMHSDSIFVTLTYNDDFLPENCSVDKYEVKTFIKRLRERILPRKIRYYCVGEYGDTSHRPHYHIIIFGMALFEKEAIEKAWSWQGYQMGHIMIGDVNFSSARYVTGYIQKCLKKLDPYNEKKYPWMLRANINNKNPVRRSPEFVTTSNRKGGLGIKFAYKIADEMKKNKINPYKVGMIRIGKKLCPVGRYLRTKMLERMGLDYYEIKKINNTITLSRLAGADVLNKSYVQIRQNMLPHLDAMEKRQKFFRTKLIRSL